MLNNIIINTNHWDTWLDNYENNDERAVTYEQILDYLRHGDSLRVKHATRTLQCMVQPTFTPLLSYEIYNTGKHFTLLKTTCTLKSPASSPGDKRRRMEFIPNLTYHHTDIKRETVQAVYNCFTMTPPVWFPDLTDDAGQGRDGVFYELAFDNAHTTVRYRWWSQMPDEWKPMHTAMAQTIESFESEF